VNPGFGTDFGAGFGVDTTLAGLGVCTEAGTGSDAGAVIANSIGADADAATCDGALWSLSGTDLYCMLTVAVSVEAFGLICKPESLDNKV
jgi:hypothetical protein